MKINKAIICLEDHIKNPSLGLPKEIFYFISKITPLVNVDLLIKDENERTLLSWRNDPIHGVGWHIPGGIVRFKERLETRIKKVAKIEIGTNIKFEPTPITINQIINDHDTRGHFISFLYKCFLSEKYSIRNVGLKERDNGYLKWHNQCPPNLIKCHKEIYKNFI